jgi:hypothetical protein
MSTNLIPANIQVPAHLMSRVGVPSVLASSITGGIGGGAAYPRISIKGARFRIVEGDTETVLDSLSIDVVIVGANPRLSKTFYAKQWTPDAEPEAPDCQSVDGIAPDADSTSPQNDLCASCPQNAWGSKVNPITGQEVKACADQKRLAVIAADDPTGPVYLLQVTPAALKGLNQYQKELTVRGIPPEIVKTRITFDTDASYPLLKFGFGGFLDADVQTQVDTLFDSPAVKEVTGETPRKAVAVPALAAPKPAAVAVAAPKPVVKEPEPVAAAPAPEPAPAKRGFGAAKSTTKAKVVSGSATAAQKPAVAAAPAAAAAAAVSLADEIAALVGEVAADDA